MANEVKFDLKANDKASPVIDQVRSKLNGLLGGTGSQAVGLTQQMGGAAVSAALGAAGLAMSFKEVYGKVMEASYEAKRFVVMGKRFSMPAAEIAKLSRYAESAGLNVGTIGRGMLMLQKFANDGIGGATGQTKELIDKLGLTKADLEEVRGGGMNAFIKIREAMGDMMSEGEQMAVWQQLIGQRAFEMAEFLKKTPQEMAEATTKAIGMSERVIQGLASGQKAYAEFQAEISKLFGELAHDFSWLFGIVGWILTAIMAGVRLTRLTGATVKWVLSLVYSLYRMIRFGITDGLETAKNATKDYGETWAEVTNDLARDRDKLLPFGDEKKNKKTETSVKKSLRTFEEIAAYNDWIKELKKEQLKLDLEAAYNDEIKIDLMKERIEVLKKEIEEKSKGYATEAEFVKEIGEKKMEQEKRERELAKLQEKAAYKKMDLALRGDLMNREEAALEAQGISGSGFNDRVFELQKAQTKADTAFRKAQYVMKDKYASEDDRAAAQLDFREALLEVNRLQQGMDKGAASPNPIVDSLQSVGGGGTIGMPSGGVGEAQLSELKTQTGILQAMLTTLINLGASANASGYGSTAQFKTNTSVGKYINAQDEAAKAAAAKAAAHKRWLDSMSPTERANYEAENEPVDPEAQAKTRALVEKWKQDEIKRKERELSPMYNPYINR